MVSLDDRGRVDSKRNLTATLENKAQLEKRAQIFGRRLITVRKITTKDCSGAEKRDETKRFVALKKTTINWPRTFEVKQTKIKRRHWRYCSRRIKMNNSTAAPAPDITAKKQKLEDDKREKDTRGVPDIHKRLESETKALSAEKDELRAKYDTSQANLRAANGVQYRMNKEHKNALAELEKQ